MVNYYLVYDTNRGYVCGTQYDKGYRGEHRQYYAWRFSDIRDTYEWVNDSSGRPIPGVMVVKMRRLE